MDIHFTVTGQEAGQAAASLHVGISGSGLELTGLPCGGKLTFQGTLGNITFAVLPAVLPTASKEAEQPQPVAEATAVPHIEEEKKEAAPSLEAPAQAVPVQAPAAVTSEDQPVPSLFDCLVALRKQLSSEFKVPPYIIFHDSTLREMCSVLPEDLQALKGIQGIGQAKLERYGARFIEAIQLYTTVYSSGEVA